MDPFTVPGGMYGASIGDPQPRPFLTLPSQCDTSVSTEVSVESWQSPGQFVTESSPGALMTGCEKQKFNPTITVQPTSHEAAAPTGLDVDLSVPQNDNPRGLATPNVRTAVTQLPAGMAVNPSAADGLTGCPLAEVGLDNNNDPTCPDSSKIGTVEIESPLTAAPLHGFIYQAKQNANPFGSTLGFYTVAQGEGLTIKLAAEVTADPDTGRLTTTFTDSPQLVPSATTACASGAGSGRRW